jgi:hypothetical protein
MFGAKGFRARENAAKLRNNRRLVSDEVRAARFAVLQAAGDVSDDEYVTVAVKVEKTEEIPTATTAETPAHVETPADTETPADSDGEKVEGDVDADAVAAAALKEAADKAEAEKAEAEKADAAKKAAAAAAKKAAKAKK